MNHPCPTETRRTAGPNTTASPRARPRAGWLELFIRHAGSVAVDHTHLLPLRTLEAEQRAGDPTLRAPRR